MEKEKLYEALGELLYAMAKADGTVQESEIRAIDNIVKNHSWGNEIKWSFDYENRKENNIEDVLKKAIDICHQNGASAEYLEFIDMLEIIAKAHEEFEDSEKNVITQFRVNLTEKFKKDLERNKLFKI
jgi:uncharacterized tellurite resistance protein B-like protein